MITSAIDINTQVQAKGLRFEDNLLFILLNDGREISLPIDRMEWLQWLAKATPEQRARWTIEPGGFAIYWEDLDDGIEIEHVLSMQPLA
jgi:hypothetical protein